MRKLTKEEKDIVSSSLEAYTMDLKYLQKLLGPETQEKTNNIIIEANKLKTIFKKFATKIYVEE